jgi:hypothetical protein
MNICQSLRINETIFEGFLTPETIHDALIFFSTEITDSNNIPYHIKKLQIYINSNPHATIEELINFSDRTWLLNELNNQLDRNELNTQVSRNEKKEILTNFFTLCIENFDIIRTLNSHTFFNICKSKIEEIKSLKYNSNNKIVLLKSNQLKDLFTIYGI